MLQQIKRSLLDALQPYLFLFTISGLLPYSWKRGSVLAPVGTVLLDNESPEENSSTPARRHPSPQSAAGSSRPARMMCSLAVLITIEACLIGYFCAWVYYVAAPLLHEYQHTLFTIYISGCALLMTYAIPLCVSLAWNWPKLSGVMRSLSEIDVTAEEFAEITSAGPRRGCSFFVAWLFTTTSLSATLAAIGGMWYSSTQQFGKMASDALAVCFVPDYALNCTIACVGDLLLVNTLHLIKKSYKILVNDKLSKLSSEFKGTHEERKAGPHPLSSRVHFASKSISKHAWGKNTEEISIEAKLREARMRHGMLCKLAACTAGCFSGWVLVATSYFFFFALLAGTVLIASCSVNNQGWATLGKVVASVLGPTFILAVIRVVSYCHAASAIKDEESETGLILATCLHPDIDGPEESAEICRFQSQLIATRNEFSASGFFNVSNGLLLSILGNLASYIVIILEITPK